MAVQQADCTGSIRMGTSPLGKRKMWLALPTHSWCTAGKISSGTVKTRVNAAAYVFTLFII